jgi:hypothetical protein
MVGAVIPFMVGISTRYPVSTAEANRETAPTFAVVRVRPVPSFSTCKTPVAPVGAARSVVS